MFVTKEQLLRPAQIHDAEIPNVGTVRIRELTRSQMQDFELWLRPDGKLDEYRNEKSDLKLSLMCLVDEHGKPLFEVADDEFEAFDKQMSDKSAVPWKLIEFEVLKANGFVRDTGNDLGKKSENSKPITEESSPTD